MTVAVLEVQTNLPTSLYSGPMSPATGNTNQLNGTSTHLLLTEFQQKYVHVLAHLNLRVRSLPSWLAATVALSQKVWLSLAPRLSMPLSQRINSTS